MSYAISYTRRVVTLWFEFALLVPSLSFPSDSFCDGLAMPCPRETLVTSASEYLYNVGSLDSVYPSHCTRYDFSHRPDSINKLKIPKIKKIQSYTR